MVQLDGSILARDTINNPRMLTTSFTIFQDLSTPLRITVEHYPVGLARFIAACYDAICSESLDLGCQCRR